MIYLLSINNTCKRGASQPMKRVFLIIALMALVSCTTNAELVLDKSKPSFEPQIWEQCVRQPELAWCKDSK